jgi:hypothetical protein
MEESCLSAARHLDSDPGMTRVLRLVAAISSVLALLLRVSPAWAEPWFGWGQNRAEERYLNGDLDVEDLVTGTVTGRSRHERGETHAGTWISIGGFYRTFEIGSQDVGLLLVAGIAFDRLDRGRREGPDNAFLGDGTKPPAASPPSSEPTATPAPSVMNEPSRVVVTPAVARHAVQFAWRTAGLGVTDAAINSMIARARASAALPEARLRAMRVFLLDGSQSTIVPLDTSSYGTEGATLVLEGRLTWRLDRLLYADDEPSLERLRLDRQDARSKVAGRVLDALFQWQRAWLAVHKATPGTREATDATMRLIESEAGLDVMTGGWFGAWAAEVHRRDDQKDEKAPEDPVEGASP